MTPRQELDALLDTTMRQALRQAQQWGGLAPFALLIGVAGENAEIAADSSALPDRAAQHAWVVQQVTAAAAAGRCRAVAVARHIELAHRTSGRKTDVIEVTLDHADAPAVTCYMPYDLGRGRLSTAELVATAATTTFFAAK